MHEGRGEERESACARTLVETDGLKDLAGVSSLVPICLEDVAIPPQGPLNLLLNPVTEIRNQQKPVWHIHLKNTYSQQLKVI